MSPAEQDSGAQRLNSPLPRESYPSIKSKSMCPVRTLIAKDGTGRFI
jgi:hypothetical protein